VSTTRARTAWRTAGIIVIALIVVFFAVLLWPTGAAPQLGAAVASNETIAHGAYMAAAADCIACHTTEGGKAYAGGRAFKLPFGTIYSPNITPDADTGIGNWSDGEFLRAMHDGIGKNGEHLYPAFPYTAYSKMTDADALAIKAYLFSLPPVRSAEKKNDLGFPFNQRRFVRFWNILFAQSKPFREERGRTAAWNRGAYLVTAVGHCGECHTPRNLLYGLSSKSLAGETMQGWTAWNITSDPDHGIGKWSVDDLATYFRDGYAPGRGVASGPMKEAVDYSLSRLTDGDRHAIAVYLQSVEPVESGPVPRSQISARTADAATEERQNALGVQIFEGACASCHAFDGRGLQTPAASLVGRRSVVDPQGLNVVQTVLAGGAVRSPHGLAFMPAFDVGYSDEEIAAASNFVLAHFGGQQGSIKAGDVAKARQH
jgi:mono/diheme cytochrome c family protein